MSKIVIKLSKENPHLDKINQKIAKSKKPIDPGTFADSPNNFFNPAQKPKEIVNFGCWILDYQPTFQNLLLPNDIYHQFYQFIINKTLLNNNQDNNQDNNQQNEDIPLHIQLIGKSGYGKWMLIQSFLDLRFGITYRDFRSNSEYPYIKSYNNIFIIDLNMLSNSEKKNCVNFIINVVAKRSFDGSLKYLILRNIDNLNLIQKSTIAYLIEKKTGNLRLICTNKSINIKNIKLNSLSYNFTLRNMKLSEFKIFIKRLNKEYQVKVDYKIGWRLYQANNYNLRDTLLMLQNSVQNYQGKYISPVNIQLVSILLNNCLKFESKSYHIIRENLYKLIGIGITPTDIIKTTIGLIIKNKQVNGNMKYRIINTAAEMEHAIQISDRKIFALEKFFFDLITILDSK
jgi:hypothetical protein